MATVLDQRAIAKRPQQARAKRRFEAVLGEAEVLLMERGLTGFSIPELAARLGYTRASIYKFFPTPYAILNELLRRYLGQLQDWLFQHAEQLAARDWRDVVAEIVTLAAQFHNEHPVARLLILGGPVTDESYRAQEMTILHLGQLARQLAAQRGVELPPPPPDIPMLAVDIGTTCFRVSYFMHGEITPEYRDEAIHAMVAYMSRYAPDAEEAGA